MKRIGLARIALIALITFTGALVLESCSSGRQANCGSKAQKRRQHKRTKSMVGAGWVR